MNIRDSMIQDMYDLMNEQGLYDNLQKAIESASNQLETTLPSKEYNRMLTKLCKLEHSAFFAGANMVLDFITGKEVVKEDD